MGGETAKNRGPVCVGLLAHVDAGKTTLCEQLLFQSGAIRSAGRVDQRTALLDGADLPLPGLGVEDGALTYNGRHWNDMSGSDQLRVATAIVRKLNPACGFVLLDKLEQMDLGTLQEFCAWLQAEDLQAIATRVSTGGECQIIIEDGRVAEPAELTPTAQPAAPVYSFQGGLF